MMSDFDEHFAVLPIVAILRGVVPEEVENVARVLFDEGIRLVEIPLNSPQALDGIARLSAFAGRDATVGAGTVMTLNEVRQVMEAGGELLVSPHCDPSIVQACNQSNVIPIPGFRTATEAFDAVRAGARILKFFPAAEQTASEIGALKVVLSSGTRVLAVGGVTASNAGVFRSSGADGLGIGSSLFRPGKSLAALRSDARAIVESWRRGCDGAW